MRDSKPAAQLLTGLRLRWYMEKQLEYTIIQSDDIGSTRHKFVIRVKYPLKTVIVGCVEWNYDLNGYVFNSDASHTLTSNILSEVYWLMSSLNNGLPNKHLTKNDF